MNNRKKLRAEREMAAMYAEKYAEAVVSADYYKNLCNTVAYAYLLAIGHKKEDITEEKIQDSLDRIGGRKELW